MSRVTWAVGPVKVRNLVELSKLPYVEVHVFLNMRDPTPEQITMVEESASMQGVELRRVDGGEAG